MNAHWIHCEKLAHMNVSVNMIWAQMTSGKGQWRTGRHFFFHFFVVVGKMTPFMVSDSHCTSRSQFDGQILECKEEKKLSSCFFCCCHFRFRDFPLASCFLSLPENFYAWLGRIAGFDNSHTEKSIARAFLTFGLCVRSVDYQLTGIRVIYGRI